MRYLLDTHTIIWFSNADKELSKRAKSTIENYQENICYVSIASLWEIAIKVNIGKLKLKHPLDDYKLKLIENNIDILPLTFEHILLVSALPIIHRDPFDRIIITQAQEESLTIITHDKNFQLYKNIHLLW